MIAEWKTQRYSLDEYLKLVERGVLDREKVELIRGEVRPMSPQGIDHISAVSLTNVALVLRFHASCTVWTHGTCPLGFDSCPEPDFAILSGSIQHNHANTRREYLAFIEVSHSSLPYDQGEKAQLYAEAGVPEYWIINLVDRQIEVHRDPAAEGYRTRTIHRPGEEVAFHFAPDQPIAVAEVLP